MQNKKKIKDCEHKNIFGTGFTNWYSEIECIECGEKVEQEPTCQHCSWCPDCDPKECNHIEPKTEGRECRMCGTTTIDHTEIQCQINRQLSPNRGVSSSDDTIKPTLHSKGSPKQDTWEDRFKELQRNCRTYDEMQENTIGFIRSELQRERQELIEKIKDYWKENKEYCFKHSDECIDLDRLDELEKE